MIAKIVSVALLGFGWLLAQFPVAGPITIEGRGSLGHLDGGFSSSGGSLSERSMVFSTIYPLEPNASGLVEDIYLRDFLAWRTVLVSTTPAGGQSNGDSRQPRISRDDEHLVFVTKSTNIVATSGVYWEVVYKNLRTGLVENISLGVGGAFPNADSFDPDVSNDGRYVLFWSFATNLTPNDNEGQADVFVRDRTLGITRRVSQSLSGVGGDAPSIWGELSGNGSTAIFATASSNLIGPFNPLRAGYEIYACDLSTSQIEVVSIAINGLPSQGLGFSRPSISDDGRFVASACDCRIDPAGLIGSVFVRDRKFGVTEIINHPSGSRLQDSGGGDDCSISADGRYVLFTSNSSSLVPNDSNAEQDTFVHDRLRQTTTRVSVGRFGEESNGWSSGSIHPSGRWIALSSGASNLVTPARPPFTGGPYYLQRYVADLGPQENLGFAAGSGPWRPYARATQPRSPVQPWTIALLEAPTNAMAAVAISLVRQDPVIPVLDGGIVVSPNDFLMTLTTDGRGVASVPLFWPPQLPSGIPLYAQFAVVDLSSPIGVSLSNAIRIESP